MPGWSAGRGPGAGQKNFRSASRDGDVVDAGLAAAHQAAVVELPQLVAVAAAPVAGGVAPLVLNRTAIRSSVNAHRAFTSRYSRSLRPLPAQEPPDGVPARDELPPVPPHRVLRVGQADPLRVPGVPGVLGQSYLAEGGLPGERRDDARAGAVGVKTVVFIVISWACVCAYGYSVSAGVAVCRAPALGKSRLREQAGRRTVNSEPSPWGQWLRASTLPP